MQKETNEKQNVTVAIVGAGPLGIALAIAFKKNDIDYLQFDRAQMAQAIYNFPIFTHFFSSSERISIADTPVQTQDQQKCTREEYLAYLRSLAMKYQLKIHSFEEVTQIETVAGNGFQLATHSNKGTQQYTARYLVLATGGTSFPRRLNVPGEDLPHVSIKMEDPHKYFQKRVFIIGGKNSAAETALRCFHAGAKSVSIVCRAEKFSESIKYWILPELESYIRKGDITCHFQTEVKEILEDRIVLMHGDKKFEVETDFVIKTIGFNADQKLIKQLGVPLQNEKPQYDHHTMETTIPGLYLLGTVVGGTQKKFEVFIENSREHVNKILNSLGNKLGIQIQKSSRQLSLNANLEE